MLRNLSITEKLLGRPDPSRAVKRRVHAGFAMPETRHVVDVTHEGTPPTVQPPLRSHVTLHIQEVGWTMLRVPALPEGT